MQEEKITLQRQLDQANLLIKALKQLVDVQRQSLIDAHNSVEMYRYHLGISSKAQNHNPILKVVRH